MMRIVAAALGLTLFACADPTANIHGKIGLTTPRCGAEAGDVIGFDLVVAPAAAAPARSTSTRPANGVHVSIACLGDLANEAPFDIDIDQPGNYGITITPWIWTAQPQVVGLVPAACTPIQVAPRDITGSVDLQTLQVAAVVAP